MEIMEYLCHVPCRTARPDSCCPILPRCQAEQYGMGESVNLSGMAARKV
ncbi:hypothetical protein [Parabacteroides sp. ZJ-118]|nr:hypothetical protein [Parabacteroides sp. ZJ-118]